MSFDRCELKPKRWNKKPQAQCSISMHLHLYGNTRIELVTSNALIAPALTCHFMPMRFRSTGRRHTPVFPSQGFLGEWCQVQTASKAVKSLYGKLGTKVKHNAIGPLIMSLKRDNSLSSYLLGIELGILKPKKMKLKDEIDEVLSKKITPLPAQCGGARIDRGEHKVKSTQVYGQALWKKRVVDGGEAGGGVAMKHIHVARKAMWKHPVSRRRRTQFQDTMSNDFYSFFLEICKCVPNGFSCNSLLTELSKSDRLEIAHQVKEQQFQTLRPTSILTTKGALYTYHEGSVVADVACVVAVHTIPEHKGGKLEEGGLAGAQVIQRPLIAKPQGEPEQVAYGQPQGEPRQGYDVGILRHGKAMSQGEFEQVVYGQPQGEPRQRYDMGVMVKVKEHRSIDGVELKIFGVLQTSSCRRHHLKSPQHPTTKMVTPGHCRRHAMFAVLLLRRRRIEAAAEAANFRTATDS
ncbi:hypothetical protein LXL04_030032 [Taraxacum kok-saghyz]